MDCRHTNDQGAILNRVTAVLRRWKRNAVTRSNIARLRRDTSPTARLVGDALTGARKGSTSTDEDVWIERVENLRADMTASEDEFVRHDYGAGGSTSTRTRSEMEAGVPTEETLGHFARKASKPRFWCLFLFRLVRTAEPHTCIEMGAAVGISGAYQAAALALNGSGTLTSLEGDPTLAKITRGNFERLGLDHADVVPGRFDQTLRNVLTERQPVDYVFVDGHHDHDATLEYFELILPFLSDSAILVFDDVAWSAGMKKAWASIAGDARVTATVDLGQIGVCIVDRSVSTKSRYRIPLK
jgi:predicted O-methyltransferase YrrM